MIELRAEGTRRALPHRAVFWLVTYGFALSHIGTNLLSPLYSVFAADFGFSATTLTLIFAAYAFTLLPLMVLFGRTSDRWGRRRHVLAGLFLSAAASVLLAFAQSTAWLFAARITQGVGMAAISGAASAEITESDPNREHASVVSTIAFAGGAATGPLAAGLLAQYAPRPTVLAFALHAGTVALVLLGLLAWRERGRHGEHRTHAQPKLRVPPGCGRLFTRAAGTLFLAWGVVGLFLAVVPGYAGDLLHTTNLAVHGSFPFAMLATSGIAQLASRRLGHRPGITAGLGLLVAGMACVVVAFPTESIALIIIGSVVAGAGHGLAFASAVRSVNEIAPPRQRGGLLAALYVPLYLGVGLPVAGVGILAERLTLFAAVTIFAAAIAVLSLAVICGGTQPRRTP